MNTSQRAVYDTLIGARAGDRLTFQANWVHVAVAAEAHMRAANAVGAGGQRIIVRSGPFTFQHIRKLYISFYPVTCGMLM